MSRVDGALKPLDLPDTILEMCDVICCVKETTLILCEIVETSHVVLKYIQILLHKKSHNSF